MSHFRETTTTRITIVRGGDSPISFFTISCLTLKHCYRLKILHTKQRGSNFGLILFFLFVRNYGGFLHLVLRSLRSCELQFLFPSNYVPYIL